MKRPLKPRVLGDISVKRLDERGWSAFGSIPARINLIEERIVRIPFTRVLRVIIIIAAAAFLFLSTVAAPTLLTKPAGNGPLDETTSSPDPSVERNVLESQLTALERQIDEYEEQIASYETQGKTLNGQIAELNDKVSSLGLAVEATGLTIQQLNTRISQTQSQIAATQTSIAGKKAAMSSLMQAQYEDDHVSLLQVLLSKPELSDFWNETEDITLVESDLRLTTQQVTDLQNELQTEEQEFQMAQSDVATAAIYQSMQKESLASTKAQKAQLLAATQGQESKYQTLLQQTQATAAQIRNRIFELLGGGQLSFEDAYQYAKFASNATGIDPAFLLAVLDRESELGQNVGQCSYQSAMAPTQVSSYLSIMQSLGLDPNEFKVSCPNADGQYGGAMGPAQFEPSTWEIYAPKVQQITGDYPASPWNNADAFVATALYLKSNMTGCASAYAAIAGQERCTAAKYYAGGNWQSYLWTYGEAVVERAQNFASDIQTINAAPTNS